MTHASVFSGIGGPEVAATMLGWDNLFHCEINPFGRKVLDYWYPNSKSYEDITKTDFTEWNGKIDVLTGGFPCQPFSYAGKRGGAEDDRYLWPFMFRCIDQVQPTWIVAENVAGILTMVEQGEVSKMASQGNLFGEDDGVRGYQLRETFTLERICDDLESHGYEVQPVLIPACGVGAPHRRDRVFIVGHRISEDTLHVRREQRPNEEQGSERNERNTGAGDSERLRGEASRTVATDTSDARLQHGHQSGGEESKTGTIQGQRCDTIGNVHAPTNGDRGQTPTAESSAGLTSPHTDSHRGRKGDEYMESQLADGAEPFGNGRERNAADTEGQWSGKLRVESQTEGARMRNVLFGDSSRLRCTPDEVGSRWRDFPSVSPVHRGNDGLPFDVDRLTLSFGKWRTEALKAYGNAIVPQVMYEIFRAIQIVEDNQ